MNKSKAVTVFGLVVAIAAILVDPANAPWLTAIFGVNATAKLSAIGALIAAVGKSLFSETATPPQG